MCQSDLYPTEYDLEPVRLDHSPSITELELRAVRLVDVAEKVSEPLNRFSIARGAVRVVASLARARRDRSKGGR
jgi:hypothetical protein